jgi:hypothetical protein
MEFKSVQMEKEPNGIYTHHEPTNLESPTWDRPGLSVFLFSGESRPQPTKLDIQILHVERIVFDKFAACFYVLTHQRGEDGLALGDVFELD